METAFTPVSATIGGALIGLSAALLWVANGRIAGISGILGGLGSAAKSDMDWRLTFLAGLVVAPLLYAFAATAPAIAIGAGPTILIAGGLLVGIGTRLGGGCTSGHGVCGLARLSWRSVVATGLFMVSAAATVLLTRHVFGG
jgi:uncharacterized membrane protein YedE/YeeE